MTRFRLPLWFWNARINMLVVVSCMLESKGSRIVPTGVLKTQSASLLTVKISRAKAQRRKEKRKVLQVTAFSWRSPLRLCIFAGNKVFRLSATLIFLCVPVIATQTNGQRLVTITMLTAGEVRVEAHSLSSERSWSFRNAYAGILGIAERVQDFRAVTRSDQDAKATKIATGEFRADLDASKISYRVNLSKPGAGDVSHVSWIAGDYGLLMLADLLPQDFTNLSVRFELPPEWSVSSSTHGDGRMFQVVAPEKSIFFIGRSLRKAVKNVDGMPVTTVLGGTWSFKDGAVLSSAGKVMKKYLELTGVRLPDGAFVMIAALPVKVGSTKWRAETRGSTVVLLIDPAANFQNWVGQLSVIFTHELLHLWVPNWLRLEGDYDWFFEGFTLYTALQTALQLKIINFKEYLDTLARVYDSYLSFPEDISLIDASERRWITSNSLVYDKGMLVAFLYDLKIRKESGGNLTLADRYRELFGSRVAANANGNEAIIALLDSASAMNGFAKSYIESSAKLELEHVLPAYGLTLDSSGAQSQLRINSDLNAQQKQLLRSLGYRK
jgi:hypothetical protein